MTKRYAVPRPPAHKVFLQAPHAPGTIKLEPLPFTRLDADVTLVTRGPSLEELTTQAQKEGKILMLDEMSIFSNEFIRPAKREKL